MVLSLGVLLLALLVGFALGRVKNKAKLAAAKAVIAKYEAQATAEAAAMLADIKAKL